MRQFRSLCQSDAPQTGLPDTHSPLLPQNNELAMNTTQPSRTALQRYALPSALLALGVLTLVAILARPLMPIDETRYVGVAWEMWLRGDFLVPFKNGMPYSHKPPLLMWLFQLGWTVFGVNEWWPRLVSPLASAVCLVLTGRLARRLWPDRPDVPAIAVLVLSSCLFWTVFSTSAMFDVLLTLPALIGLHGIVDAANGQRRRGILWLGLAIGLGVLTKGPVILLHLLPVALLAPWWRPELDKRRWVLVVVLALLLGVALALAWAVPAGLSGGDAYFRAIFWGQTADRMVESFAHRRPVWWYLPVLPALFFPWFVWPPLWRAAKTYVKEGFDPGGRMLLAWFVPVLVALSLISGKQPHYVIPLFPAFALFAARALDAKQVRGGFWLPALLVVAPAGGLLLFAHGLIKAPHGWTLTSIDVWPCVVMAILPVVLWLCDRRLSRPIIRVFLLGIAAPLLGQLALAPTVFAGYELRPMARLIRTLQVKAQPIAILGEYHDQYHFAGRLEAPIQELDGGAELNAWQQKHPDGWVIVYAKTETALREGHPVLLQPYRGHFVALVDARSAVALFRKGNLESSAP